MQWCASLSSELPFLSVDGKDGYSRHYQLSRLSELMGRRLADVTIDYEADLIQDVGAAGDKLAALDILGETDREHLTRIIDREQKSNWLEERPNSWFEQREGPMESELQSLGLLDGFGVTPLDQIKEAHASAWREFAGRQGAVVETLVQKLSECRSEQTRLLREIDRLNELNPAPDGDSEVFDESVDG